MGLSENRVHLNHLNPVPNHHFPYSNCHLGSIIYHHFQTHPYSAKIHFHPRHQWRMALCDLCFVQLELRWFPPWKKVLGQLKLGSRKWCFLPWQKVLGQLKLGSRKWCHGKGNGQRHAQGYLRRHGMLSENFRPENHRCTPFIGYGMLTPTSTKKTTKFVEHSSSSTEPTKKRFVGF